MKHADRHQITHCSVVNSLHWNHSRLLHVHCKRAARQISTAILGVLDTEPGKRGAGLSLCFVLLNIPGKEIVLWSNVLCFLPSLPRTLPRGAQPETL